jgi:hypothetical protein
MLSRFLLFYAFDYYEDHTRYNLRNQLVRILSRNLYLLHYGKGIDYVKYKFTINRFLKEGD